MSSSEIYPADIPSSPPPLVSTSSYRVFPRKKPRAWTQPTPLEALLILNSVFTVGTGLCSMFAPKLIANPRTWTYGKQEEWRSGTLVIGLRNLFGCASMALGITSLVAYLRPHEKPTTPILAGLAFYHISAMGPVLVDDELFQGPEVIAHGILGFGFLNFALKEV